MKPLFTLTVLALLSFSLSSAASAQWTGSSADQMISYDDNEYARGVQLIYDEFTGMVHIIWAEDAPSVRELHYGRSSDGGASWTSETSDRVISFPDGKALYEEPAVELTPEGPIVVWSEDVSSTREVHLGISTDGGLTFSCESQDIILSDPTSAVDTGVPSIAVDEDLTYHVVWQQVVGDVAEVHYSHSTDGGQTWSGTSGDRVISFPDGNGAITPKIVVGENNRLIVVWRETGDSGRPTIHVGISDDGGDTWSSETADREISQPVQLMTNLAVATSSSYIAPTREIHVVYTASFDDSSPYHYEVYATWTTDNGATWTGETVTTMISHDEDHTRSAHNPDVFMSCATVIAAWDEEEDTAGTNEQHISQYNGVEWSGADEDEIISFPDGENGYRPSIGGVQAIAIPPDGRGTVNDTWVAWTEFAGGSSDNYEVHVSATQLCSAGSVPSPDNVRGFRIRAVPNPFVASTALTYTLPRDGRLRLGVYDPMGRSVRRLLDSRQIAGTHAVTWDGRDDAGHLAASGVYILRLEAEGISDSRKLLLTR